MLRFFILAQVKTFVMNMFRLLLCIGIGLLASCTGPRAVFVNSENFDGAEAPESLLIVVVGDEKTKAAYEYLKNDLVDTIATYGVETQGVFHCCRDENTNMENLLLGLIPEGHPAENTLTVVTAGVVSGIGANNSRELQLILGDARGRNPLWQGKVSAETDLLVADQQFRSLAQELTNAIVKEFEAKGILPGT